MTSRFLRQRFGEDVERPKLGPVIIRDEKTHESAHAFTFAVNTAKFIETGKFEHRFFTGAIIVPKDGALVHWAPTVEPVDTYLGRVARGERSWSGQVDRH